MPTKNPDIYVEEHNLIIAPDGVQTSQRKWPLDWGAIWVGAMAAVAAALLIGLIGIAVGAHHVGTRPARLSDLTLAGLVFSVIGAFFSFVLGGWAAGGIAGTRRADHASLQGAAVWLVALPMLVIFAALGAGGFFGAWIGGLAGTPVWAASSGVTPDPDAALAARNSALGAVTALLIGLMGGVIGGWLASGEPMTFADRREPHMQPQEG